MIPKIAWDEFYLTGVEEIDVQHKHLTVLVNKCISKANGYLPNDNLENLLEDLWFYTKWHFSCEESLMKILEYDKYESHLAEHIDLLDKLNEKIDQILENTYLISELRDYLHEWLGNHAHNLDKELGAFVISKWN